MRREMPLSMLRSLSILILSAVTLLPVPAIAEGACSGHKLLPTPRPESSCSNVKPRIYASPNGELRALVFSVDVSLYATPDMESRVVIRNSKGDTLTSKDYSSPRGTNGYYVFNAKWSRLAILRLQHVVVGRSFALVISDDGLQPREEPHRRIERHDRRQADGFSRFPLHRTAYGRRQHVETTWIVGRQGCCHRRSRGRVRKAGAIFGLELESGRNRVRSGVAAQPTPSRRHCARIPRHAATGGTGSPRFSRRVLPAYALRNKPRCWSSGTTKRTKSS
jgi:hypothetical protein